MSVKDVRDTALIYKLVERNGMPTIAVFEDGEEHIFYDITYGYDLGEEYAHIYTNMDSKVEGAQIEFFLQLS
ncbi:MAG: hypothetical protein AAF718_02815 [Pseudomonadota bacterium]